jgi:hypothetical protein
VAASYLGLTRDELIEQVKSGKTLAQIAAAQGKSVDGLIDALVAAGTAEIDKKLADGTISQAQHDWIVAHLRDRVTAFVNGTGGIGFGGAPVNVAGTMADVAASYLGLTTDELMEQVKSGKTLAQIAGAQGKSVDGLIDALVAAATAEIDKKLADGTISQAQHDRIVSQLRDRITAFVNGAAPGFGSGGSPFGGGQGGPPAGGSPFAP